MTHHRDQVCILTSKVNESSHNCSDCLQFLMRNFCCFFLNRKLDVPSFTRPLATMKLSVSAPRDQSTIKKLKSPRFKKARIIGKPECNIETKIENLPNRTRLSSFTVVTISTTKPSVYHESRLMKWIIKTVG